MKTIELKGAKRTEIGKAAMKKVRRSGNVPAVVYGQGEPTPIVVNAQSLTKLLHSPETFVVQLDLEGDKQPAILREAQFHPVTDAVLHVDFIRVSTTEPVEVDLPIKLVGTSVGVLAGGKLVPMLRKLRVKGIISELPERVEVNVSKLGLGKTIRVSEIEAEGITITSPGSAGVAIVDIPRAVRQAEMEAKK